VGSITFNIAESAALLVKDLQTNCNYIVKASLSRSGFSRRPTELKNILQR